jgi:methionyl-tRNA formyltransferase
MPLSIVMMGTGEFALPTFQSLCQSDHQVVGLFTQPDRTGRGHHHHVNEMKDLAIKHDVPVFQPGNVNTPESLNDLRNLKADIFVVAAYGQILKKELLSIPRFGAVNLHASLLPKYRGAAPIQYAVLNGEKETGVTLFQIEPKLDAGPVLGMEKLKILPKETSGQLQTRIAELSIPLTLRVLADLEGEKSQPAIQTNEQVTLAPRMKKNFGSIDWNEEKYLVDCHVFAMQPWPKSYTYLHQENKKLVRLILLDVNRKEQTEFGESLKPGSVLHVDNKSLIIQAGKGPIEILTIQPEGKRPMKTEDFLRGHQIQKGDCFGSLSDS